MFRSKSLPLTDRWFRHREPRNKVYNVPEMPKTYIDISVDHVPVGRIIFVTYHQCAKTSENFRCLCTGEKGMGINGKPLHYKGNRFHRIIPGFMIQAGDIVNHDGTGGESIYGEFFPDENFHHKHRSPYKLCMANLGRNRNSS